VPLLDGRRTVEKAFLLALASTSGIAAVVSAAFAPDQWRRTRVVVVVECPCRGFAVADHFVPARL
jgi:hypothetical protein